MEKSPLNNKYFGCCAIKCLTSIERVKKHCFLFSGSVLFQARSPDISCTGHYDDLVLRFREVPDTHGLAATGFLSRAAALIICPDVNVHISAKRKWQENLCGGEPELLKYLWQMMKVTAEY